MKTKKLLPLLGILVAAVVVIGVIFVIKNKTSVLPAATQASLPHEVKVTLTDSGFAPREVTINAGDAVRFINNSSKTQASVNSDDYPSNKKYPELNLGVFEKQSTLVHIFTRSGTFTYHDQFNPEYTGTIVVQ